MSKPATFIDLFSGIGGFRLGMERNGFKCVWSCDNNKFANMVYQYKFGDENHETGDIRKVDTREIPEHDILCAGFPCQSFSLAGKRKGFEDARGSLFFEICRIARDKKPSILFLENVKGLLSNERGGTFATIINALQELGYGIEWQVLDSQYFGVPQHRERVFIIGHLGGFRGRQIFPISENNTGISQEKKEIQRKGEQFQSANICPTLDADIAKNRMSGAYILDINKKEQNNSLVFPYATPDFKEKKQNGRRIKSNNEPMFTLTGQHPHGILKVDIEDIVMNTLTEAVGTRQGSSKEFMKSVDNILKTKGQLRRLTPRECERLQGFPDDWTKYGINDKEKVIEISDTQRYKMVGNAVTVNVIEVIAKQIKQKLFIEKY